ncbi:MAG TPA: hypothetical protein VK489_15370 [Ferruginibacter sp.]|nr:hypothetical protein [Ferruginibacter sp.]
MNQENADVLNYDNHNKPKLPSGLNVLTILTFIGCVLQLLGAFWNFFNAKKSYDEMDKVIEQMNSDSMPAWARSMMGSPEHFREMITKSYENRIPIVLLALIAVALCFFGALQMRKLKKQGFTFYTIGELLPFLSQVLFIGAFSMTGFVFYFFVCISILFIFMYAMQRKHLVY